MTTEIKYIENAKFKNKNSIILSSYDIFQNNSKELYLIDPIMLSFIIIVICLFLYIIGFKSFRSFDISL